MAFQGQGEWDKANDAYHRALELNPRDSECRRTIFALKCQLGYAAQTRGEPHEAKAYYLEAIAIDGSQPAMWYNLGIACDASGDTQGAIAALEKACSLDPAKEDYRGYLETLRSKARRMRDTE